MVTRYWVEDNTDTRWGLQIAMERRETGSLVFSVGNSCKCQVVAMSVLKERGGKPFKNWESQESDTFPDRRLDNCWCLDTLEGKEEQ